MKSITLTADERLIEEARAKARRCNTTLDDEFRRWLATYARSDDYAAKAMAAIDRISPRVVVDRKFSREEMNER